MGNTASIQPGMNGWQFCVLCQGTASLKGTSNIVNQIQKCTIIESQALGHVCTNFSDEYYKSMLNEVITWNLGNRPYKNLSLRQTFFPAVTIYRNSAGVDQCRQGFY